MQATAQLLDGRDAFAAVALAECIQVLLRVLRATERQAPAVVAGAAAIGTRRRGRHDAMGRTRLASQLAAARRRNEQTKNTSRANPGTAHFCRTSRALGPGIGKRLRF